MTYRKFWPIAAAVTALALSPILIAQVTSAPVAAASSPSNELFPAIVWAWISSTLLQLIKDNKRVLLFSSTTAWWVQRAIAIALAAATSLGIHASFEPAAGVLTITGLLWPSVRDAGWEWLRQFVLQEYMYRTAVKGHTGGPA